MSVFWQSRIEVSRFEHFTICASIDLFKISSSISMQNRIVFNLIKEILIAFSMESMHFLSIKLFFYSSLSFHFFFQPYWVMFVLIDPNSTLSCYCQQIQPTSDWISHPVWSQLRWWRNVPTNTPCSLPITVSICQIQS